MVRKSFSRFDKPNPSARYDLGGANVLLSIQATALSLNVHQMGGYDREKASEYLNIPEAFELGVIMAIGYPGDPESLPENLKQREFAPRLRYRQAEFVMNHAFQ
jgi:nitroreductase